MRAVAGVFSLLPPGQRALPRQGMSPPRPGSSLAAGVVLCGIFATAPAALAQTFTVLHHFDLFTQGGSPPVTEALTLVGDTIALKRHFKA